MAGTPETREYRVKLLNNAQEKRKEEYKAKVEAALEKMIAQGIKINFTTVAKEANVSVAYLYKNDDIKTRITQIRNQQLSTPKPELANSSTAKSQQKMIAILKDKIKRQSEEIQQLKEINETLAGRVYRVTELESLVQRQEHQIKDLSARLKEQKMS